MAYFKQPELTNTPKRSNKDYLNSSRSELVNHLKTEIKKKPGHTIGDFLKKSLWSWIYHYFNSRFGKKYPYPSYMLPDTGIYNIETGSSNKPATICILSDWATDTFDSFAIAQKIKEEDPDYTIHVGDTYYVGAPPEIASNFVNDGSPWVRGNQGSFALLGNHEMYARGVAFFETLLPTLGPRDQSNSYTGQKAGYFCLQNDHWRILGLDTGYHSTGIPLIEFLPWFKPDCRLHKNLLQWLIDVVKLNDPADKRGLVILTHHQYLTAFNKEAEYLKPSHQLAELIGTERKVLWLWGHEHKLSLFGKTKVKNGLTVYGRCIGNGGTPVELEGKSFSTSEKKHGFSSLVFVDKRPQKIINECSLGFNSFAKIKLNADELTLEYFDNNTYLFSETWKADPGTGDISGKIEVPSNSALAPVPGKSWNDAVS